MVPPGAGQVWVVSCDNNQMNPIQRQQNQIQSLQALKKLDGDSNGKLSAAEIKAKLDRDQDGQLSKAELDQAGISDVGLRQEIQQKYRQGQAQPELTLFRTVDLDKRSQGLQKGLERQEQRAEKALGKKLEDGFMQTVLNHFDSNHDNALSVAEINAIDPAKLKSLASTFNLDDKDLKAVMGQLKKLADLKAPQGPDAMVLKPAEGRDFASGMRYLDDPADEALSMARLQDARQLRQEITSQYPNQKALTDLLAQIQKQGGQEAENLILLKQFLSQHPPAVAAAAAEKLTTWLQSPVNKGAAITQAQRPDYLNGLLRDLAFPEDIDQGDKGTCAAAAIQMELARKDPVKYLDLASTLAEGKSFRLLDTPQGEVRRLYPNTTFAKDKNDDRLLSSRLIQNSFMNLGHQAGENDYHTFHRGQLSNYDSRLSVDSAQGLNEADALKREARKHPDLKPLPKPVLARLSDGMSEGEMEYLAQGLFGNQWQDLAAKYHIEVEVPDPEKPGKTTKVKRVKDPEALLKEVDQALSLGRKLTIGSEDHAMLLTGKEMVNGKPVYIINSWSGRYHMTPEALKHRLTNVFTEPLPPTSP
jgi:hypothetical protein